jgi:hypothetical protein
MMIDLVKEVLEDRINADIRKIKTSFRLYMRKENNTE